MKTTNFLHGPEKACKQGALKEDKASESSVFLVAEQRDDPTSSEHATTTSSTSEETQELQYYCGHTKLVILVSIAVFFIFVIKAQPLLQEADRNDENADITHHVTTPMLLPSHQPGPSRFQSAAPTIMPTVLTSDAPSAVPTDMPSNVPVATGIPTSRPTVMSSASPSLQSETIEQQSKDDANLFGSPFIVFTEGGYSGTTAIGVYIRKIIRGHGFDYLRKGVSFEFLHTKKNLNHNKWKNKFYQEILKEKNISAEEANYEEVMIESIKRAQAKATESGIFFFFKAGVGGFGRGLKDGLDSLGASYFGMYRQNVLDRCICEIRDCFYAAKDFGFPVFAANGTRTDLCFQRRHHPEIKIQARITDGHGCIAAGEKLVQEVQRYSSNSSVITEHLFEFESSSDEDAFARSIEQWMAFLRPLLKQHLSRRVIEQVLEEYRGSRLALISQESKVYNYNELKNELEDTDEDMIYIHGD